MAHTGTFAPLGRSFRKGDKDECDRCLAPIVLGVIRLNGEQLWLCERHGDDFLEQSGETVRLWRRTPGTNFGRVTREWRANPEQTRARLLAERERIAARPGDRAGWQSAFGRESAWWREILFDFQFADELGGRPDPQELERAAIAGFCAHQELLKSHEGEYVQPIEPARTLSILTAAMTDRSGKKGEAKRLQLELACGRPLTVCSGSGKYRHGVETFALGCGLVFPDTTRAARGSHYWLRWCPEHDAHGKHPERKLLPAHLR